MWAGLAERHALSWSHSSFWTIDWRKLWIGTHFSGWTNGASCAGSNACITWRALHDTHNGLNANLAGIAWRTDSAAELAIGRIVPISTSDCGGGVWAVIARLTDGAFG